MTHDNNIQLCNSTFKPTIGSLGCELHPIRDEAILGMRFLELRNHSIRNSDLEPSKWASLAKRQPARQLAEGVAKEMNVSFPMLKQAIEFATAVETLIRSCGESTWAVLFNPMRPQSRKAILKLSRTSDMRQRYRVSGVIKGEFRSVAPHSDDTEFDTVSFDEVLSRLRWARGWLGKLLAHLNKVHDLMIIEEVKQLMCLCKTSAELLDECLATGASPVAVLPHNLSKVSVIAKVRSKEVRGWSVGMGRAALRFTVKNLWDFDEMRRRGLGPTASQLQGARSEIQQIREIVSQIEHLSHEL